MCNVAQAAFCCTHGKDGKSAREVLDLINCRFSVHGIFVPTAGFALPEISVSINLIVFNRLNEKICESGVEMRVLVGGGGACSADAHESGALDANAALQSVHKLCVLLICWRISPSRFDVRVI